MLLFKVYKCISEKHNNFYLYIKTVYYQGDMFRLSLGHLQVLNEHRSKIIQVSYINVLWNTKRSQKYYKVL
jgi:hypothetical protein